MKNLACLVCDWVGSSEKAEWHDLSHFHDDTMCDNQEGSGWWDCPKCGDVCREMEKVPTRSRGRLT